MRYEASKCASLNTRLSPKEGRWCQGQSRNSYRQADVGPEGDLSELCSENEI